MTQRQQAILKAIIEKYIKDADPVGSKQLSEGFSFGIGPAMIRQEMASLEKGGFIKSPHTSAGRVPTDKAYRLYITKDLKNKELPLPSSQIDRIKKVVIDSSDYRDLAREISKLSAEISKEIAIAGIIEENIFFTSGFSHLKIDHELRNVSYFSHLMSFIDDIDHCFDVLWQEMIEEDLRVFIGQENPVSAVRGLSLVTGRYTLSKGERGFISIVGPKRMNYKKNMALVDHISEIISEKYYQY